jgi:hypothetical protein
MFAGDILDVLRIGRDREAGGREHDRPRRRLR